MGDLECVCVVRLGDAVTLPGVDLAVREVGVLVLLPTGREWLNFAVCDLVDDPESDAALLILREATGILEGGEGRRGVRVVAIGGRWAEPSATAVGDAMLLTEC